MRCFVDHNRGRWRDLCLEAIEQYPLGSTFEVELDGRWHWHPGKEISLRHGIYMIIYFRNEGESEVIKVDQHFHIKLGRFAEMYLSGTETAIPVEELAYVRCRFVLCQPRKGYRLPSKSTSLEPITVGFCKEANDRSRD
jgi:hypothetical protein